MVMEMSGKNKKKFKFWGNLRILFKSVKSEGITFSVRKALLKLINLNDIFRNSTYDQV